MKKLLLIILLLVGCSNKNNDINKFKEEYEYLNSENIEVNIDSKYNIKYLTINEVVNFLENDTGILFFGIANDGMSRSVVETVLEVSKENELELYYYSPSSLAENDTENFANMIGILNEYLQTNEDDQKILSVPDIYFVKDGKIVCNHYGTIDDKVDLNEEEKQKLYNTYNDLAQKLRS